MEEAFAARRAGWVGLDGRESVHLLSIACSTEGEEAQASPQGHPDHALLLVSGIIGPSYITLNGSILFAKELWRSIPSPESIVDFLTLPHTLPLSFSFFMNE